MTVQRATSPLPANFPRAVQYRATENWSTNSAHLTAPEAEAAAAELADAFPSLPVRILHYTGGPNP